MGTEGTPEGAGGRLLPGVLGYVARVLREWQVEKHAPEVPRRLQAVIRRRHPRLGRVLHSQVQYLTYKCVIFWNQLTTMARAGGTSLDFLPTRTRRALHTFLVPLAYLLAWDRKHVRVRAVKQGLEYFLPRASYLAARLLDRVKLVVARGLTPLMRGLDPLARVALELAHPSYFLGQLRALGFTREEVRQWCAFNNDRGVFHVRVNFQAWTAAEFHAWARAAGISVKQDQEVPGVFSVDETGRRQLLNSPEYADGAFLFQDRASVMATMKFDPGELDLLVEVGAAPFLKSSLLLSHYCRAPPRRLVSLDSSWTRIIAGLSLLARLGHARRDHAVICADGCHLPLRELRAAVLVDAPCTSSGALDAHPEMKWHQNAGYTARHSKLQARILEAVVERLQPGSVVSYVVCSVYPEEGEQVVGVLQTTDPRARVVLETHTWPHTDACQGFFVARLVLASLD